MRAGRCACTSRAGEAEAEQQAKKSESRSLDGADALVCRRVSRCLTSTPAKAEIHAAECSSKDYDGKDECCRHRLPFFRTRSTATAAASLRRTRRGAAAADTAFPGAVVTIESAWRLRRSC